MASRLAPRARPATGRTRRRVPFRLTRAAILALVVVPFVGLTPAGAEVNMAPTAQNDTTTATSGEMRTIDVLNNDSDPEDDSLTITAVGTPGSGSAITNGYEIKYTPAAGFTGPDSFTYTVEDGNGGSDTASVAVTVNSCPTMASAIDDEGIVTAEQWVHCTSFDAHDAVGDLTPVTNPTGGSQMLMTNGTSAGALPPNNSSNSGTDHQTIHRGAHDVSTLKLDLDVPESANCLSFELAFQSEEYPEFVQTQFNDGFLAELDQSDWTVTGSSISAPNNFAYDGAGNIVSVNSSFFDDGRVVTDTGTQFDGSTSLLEVRSPITPGAHTLYLTIFDATDGETDSAAFVDRLRAFTAVEGGCRRGARQAPFAANDTLSVNEDTAGDVNVLANDTDFDGDPLSLSSWSNGAHGTVSCGATSCTYTPQANYNGSDTFTYRVTDGLDGSDTGTVSVTVNPSSDPPDAQNDSGSTSEDVSLMLPVLANDSDPDGGSIGITSSTGGTSGSVTCTSTSCTYNPDANWNGEDTFTYTITDGTSTDTATVTVAVAAVNDAPQAQDDSAELQEDGSTTVEVLGNDTDVEGHTLAVTSRTNGSDGTVECGSTSCTYSPDADYSGSDSFTYTISDGNGGTDTATVSVSVSASPDAPKANGDSLTTDEDTAGTLIVTGNDTDADNDVLSVTDESEGTHGTVTCSGGSCTYSPTTHYNGTDSFTYTISDGNGGTDTATVSVSVTALNDAPDAVADSLSVTEDTSSDVSVLTNDSDVDGDALAITGKTDGAHGTVACANGDCTYTPRADYSGSDSFTYTVSDGNGGSDTATVEVTVEAVNDAPDAVGDTLTTPYETAKEVGVTTNDIDVDGDALTVTGQTNGANGTVACSAGSCTYTPNAGFFGQDSFSYAISDGNGGTDIAIVSVEVLEPNDPPSASLTGPTATVIEGQSVTFDGSGSTDGDGTIESHEWTVDDGRTFSGPTTTFAFGDDGTYLVTLEVCDDMGACDDDSLSVTVVNAAPTIVVSSQPTVPLRIDTNLALSGQPGAVATLTATSNDPAGANDPLTYQWSFGDGTSASGSAPTVQHAYKTLGRYVVTVTVTDGDGGSAFATSGPVNVLSKGTCGTFQPSYWGKPGVKAGVVQRTQFWKITKTVQKPITGAIIKPGQTVKLQAKPTSPGAFQQVCIKGKRYMRVEKVTSSLPTLDSEYLPESALLKL